MQVSGRITHSFFCFLDRHHFDTSLFHELTHLEMSSIKDTSVWLDIGVVEDFLKNLSNEYGRHFVEKDLTTAVGHHALELKAWGDLDHVLKLSPPHLYQKIDEIFQWFISPFSMENVSQHQQRISFQCELSSLKYPYVADYMRSVLEALPTYHSEEMSEVKWDGTHIKIDPMPFGQMSFHLESKRRNPHSNQTI